MNGTRETEAEILKLARLLQSEPGRLSYLERLPAAEIRALREQVTEMLFTAHDGTLRRLAAVSRLLPIGLLASIAQHAFGPVLSARIAGLLEPGRAIEIASRLPLAFLADVAIELDPRRASHVIAGMPADRTREITRELAAREEYVTMGRFVGQLSTAALDAALAALDDLALLATAFVLEERTRFEEIIILLGEERTQRLAAAAEAAGMWSELAALLGAAAEPPAAAAK